VPLMLSLVKIANSTRGWFAPAAAATGFPQGSR
jgi:hypothetical protein